MWRLIRKGFLSNYKVSPKPNALHQVLPLGSSNISVELVASSQSSSHFATWVSKKPIFSPNLRCFLTDSSVETPTKAPPGSDIKLDMAKSDKNVSDIDQILDDEDYCNALKFELDHIYGVDVEKCEKVWSLLQSSGGAADGSLIASLEGMELVLSNQFLVRILKRFLPKQKEKIPIENLIDFFSWCIAEKPSLFRCNTDRGIVWSLCSELKKSNAYALKDLGEKESGLLNTKTLNKLIYLFSLLDGGGKAAFLVFNEFEEFGVADADTYYYTIQAISGWWPSALVYVSKRMLIAGKSPNAEKVGNIISSLCKWGLSRPPFSFYMLETAYSVYMLAKAKNSSPPMVIVDSLINSLSYLPKDHISFGLFEKAYRDNINMALSMLEGFSGEDIKSMLDVSRKNKNSVFRAIRALCVIGDVKKAEELLFKMIDAGTPLGEEIFSDEAIMMSMWRDITPYMYQTLIRGYCKLDQFDLAVNLLRIMNDHGVEISDHSVEIIQSLRLKWQRRRLEEMQQSGLVAEGGNQEVAAALNQV